MEIRKIAISEIQLAKYNPREDLKPGQPEYETLKRSMSEFGYIEPMVWNKKSKVLVAGHQRIKILLEQGLTEVEVSVVNLSPAKERQLNLLLNKARGKWNEEKLAALLEEFSCMPDFDMTGTGFNVSEVSELLDSYRVPDAEDNFDVDSALGSIQKPITEAGELIELGDHRLLCDDATNIAVLEKLMGGAKANLVDCDFPYNVNLGGENRFNSNSGSKQTKKWDPMQSDNMPQEVYEAWMRKVFANIKEVLNPGSSIYIWQGHRQFPPMYQILLDFGFHVSCVIAWIKESAAISFGDYSFQSEQCLYGWLLGASHYFAGKPGESNVWQIKRDPTKTYQHPSQKPVALRQRAVKNSSKRGDIVLDVFLGSGSLLLACESLGRRCYGLEIDPKYCDVVVRRYLSFVGKDKAPKALWDRYMEGSSHGK